MNNFTKLTQIEPNEIKGTVVSFFFIFILMAAYMILRPVRDALPSEWGDISRAVQWSYTFAISTLAVSLYNFCASRVALNKLVPSVFIFFALSFVAIFGLFKAGFDTALLGKVFYVWSSVFALFHISVFWSFTAQAYTKEQSKRVFGFINTGASAGAIVGPLIVIFLVKKVPIETVLLITSASLVGVLPLIAILNRDRKEQHSQEQGSLGNLSPNPFRGFADLFSHKQLRRIALFLFFFSGISTFLYVFQSDLLADYTSTERKELLGSLDLATNTLTILLGIFAANRFTKKFGLATALSIVPFFVALMLLIISSHAAVMLVLALQLLRKAGNYSITRPAREILFTGVSKEARFKTKPIIDVAIYRGADVFWIWSLALLGDGYLDLTIAQKFWVGAGIANIWGFIGIYLGKRHDSEETLEQE